MRMNVLQSGIFWLILLAAAVVVAIFLKKRNSSGWGFKDVVKNPGYWQQGAEDREQAEALTREAQGWSDEKVASVTKHFLFEVVSSRDAWNEARILKGLGERTQRTVIELLRDSSRYSRLVKPTGEDILPEAPFNRACDLLGDAPPAEAVEVLAPFLNDAFEEIRKDAALVVARTGAETMGPLVKKAFSDDDEYVRSYALMGLEFSLSRSGLSENLRKELFPEVLGLLREGKNADKAAEILYLLDREQATEFLLSEEVFTADSPIVHEVLEVLADAKVPVPRPRIQSLIAALERKEMEYPWTYALGEALRLLGQQRIEEDRDFIRARTNHLNKRVAEGASAGLLCSYGLEGFEERIGEIVDNSGYDFLSRPQKLYRAVLTFDGEINNGGLAQYFVNSSGDFWRDAVAGFKEMGFKERLDILNEAIAMFGKDGPSTDRSARQNQLSKLYRRNDDAFDELDSRYYNCSEVVKVLTTRFVLAQPEGFR